MNYSSSGLFHYAAALATALAEQGHKVLLLTSSHNNLAIINHPRLQVVTQDAPHELLAFFRWLASPREQQAIFHTVTTFHPDVIHFTDSHAVYVPHQWWLKRYPIVFTQHDPSTHEGDVYPYSSRIIHATQRRLASAIVVHGKHLKQQLESITDKPISIIPHGHYGFFARWRTPISRRPQHLLFFGRIVPYKGLDTLLFALLKLKAHGMTPSLTIAGSGNLTPYRPLLAQLPQVRVINRYIPEEDTIRYFDEATAIILPYREASQSGVVPIALAAGTPIIATNVGAIPEVLTNRYNALLVPPRDSHTLAAAITEIINNPGLRQQLSISGRHTAITTLAWSRVATAYQRVYGTIRPVVPTHPRVILVLPAHNEAPVLESVLKNLQQQQPTYPIIVVDDGSTDTTTNVARTRGVHVLTHRLNRGKGAAIRTGLAAAMQLGADIVVTMDADGQHDPQDIPALIEPLRQHTADVVLGMRPIQQEIAGMPHHRRIGNRLANHLTWLVYGTRVHDSQCGLRAYSRFALTKIKTNADFYHYDSQVIQEIRRHHLRFTEVPITVHYTSYSQTKLTKQNLPNALRTIYKMVWSLVT